FHVGASRVLGAGQGAKRAVVSFTTRAWQRRPAPKTRLALRVAVKKPRLRRCSSLHRMTMPPPRALHTRLFDRNACAKLSPTGSWNHWVRLQSVGAIMLRRQFALLSFVLVSIPTVAMADALLDHPAPVFSAPAADGRTIDLNAFRGKTVVLEWTNHECPFQNEDRKSTRLNSSHVAISYAVFCLKKKTKIKMTI